MNRCTRESTKNVHFFSLILSPAAARPRDRRPQDSLSHASPLIGRCPHRPLTSHTSRASVLRAWALIVAAFASVVKCSKQTTLSGHQN